MKIRKFKYLLLLSFALTFFTKGNAQQTEIYSYYLLNQQHFNPAYTGVHDYGIISLNHREQWSNFEGAPSQTNLAIQTGLFSSGLGLGLTVNKETIGALEEMESKAALSYKQKLKQTLSLSFGLDYSYQQIRLNENEINTEIDDTELDEFGTYNYTNIGSGLFLQSKKWYAGYSIPYLFNLSNASFEYLQPSLTHHLSAGYLYTYNCFFRLKPFALFRFGEGKYPSMELNLAAIFNDKYWVVTQFRNNHSWGIGFNIELFKKLRLGYMAEIPLNHLTTNGYITHEFTLSFDFRSHGSSFLNQRYW